MVIYIYYLLMFKKDALYKQIWFVTSSSVPLANKTYWWIDLCKEFTFKREQIIVCTKIIELEYCNDHNFVNFCSFLLIFFTRRRYQGALKYYVIFNINEEELWLEIEEEKKQLLYFLTNDWNESAILAILAELKNILIFIVALLLSKLWTTFF